MEASPGYIAYLIWNTVRGTQQPILTLDPTALAHTFETTNPNFLPTKAKNAQFFEMWQLSTAC